MSLRDVAWNDDGHPGEDGRPFSAARLQELQQALSAGTLDTLLAMAAQELATRPAIIAMALADRDISRAVHESHALAGSALSIGASPTGFAARQLEGALRRGDATGDPRIPVALSELREAARQAADAVPAIRCALRDTPRLAA